MNTLFGTNRTTSTRRTFIKRSTGLAAGVLSGSLWIPQSYAKKPDVRRFNLSVSVDALTKDPELLNIVKAAGVTDIWLACFFHGHWSPSIETIATWQARIEGMGMDVHNITIPLGHPSFDAKPPSYSAKVPTDAWKPGVRPDGKKHYGVSLHAPATQANVAALRKIKTTDPGIIFLDDDFRLAPSPSDIGGCFCNEHKAEFLRRNGYNRKHWDELLVDVRERRLTPVVRSWVGDTCDALTASFRAQQEAAAPEAQLGNMVMFMGSEKAGIRLPDYTGAPFRVGELMFDDKSFGSPKGKTNELFSSLLHRRFTSPELAYSETTAWPPDKLSAPNMAAKLAVTTISDVRNTMFMSGMIPFPRTHWETLAPAMRKQADLHRELAGHKPAGPFKHFWGEASRWIGDSNPYSLFMATGVPFEVVDKPGREGWTLLSDWDAEAVAAGRLKSEGTTLVCRPSTREPVPEGRIVEEKLEALYAFKRSVLPQLQGVPYVEEDAPVVCAWYPTARAVLLWNLAEKEQPVTLRYGDKRQTQTLAALDTCLLRV